MLVLARRINESIMIGDDIEVVLVDVKGDQVKLGIRAPRSIAVHRTEVYQEIQEQNRLAADSAPPSLNELGRLLKEKGDPSDKG